MNKNQEALPPVVVLGDAATALSIIRSLGRQGVKVYSIGEATHYVRSSRYCRLIEVPDAGGARESWTKYLLGPQSDHLRGAVLLSACDLAIEIIAEHRQELSKKFLLDLSNPEAQLWMLNKLDTYQQAVAAGVETPRFWPVENRDQILALKDELVYPLIVKPIYSHHFQSRFPIKFFVAQNFDQLISAYDKTSTAGFKAMLVEMIPGPDSLLCSYYTYLDDRDQPLFDFTKRVIRRYPVNMGSACHHLTDWNPAVRTEALKLFKFVRLRGLANAEFKLDQRDGKLKLIECNARFTAANCLVYESGYDLPLFVYNRLTGRPLPSFGKYRTGMRLWHPVKDYYAFREMNRQGSLSFRQWLLSIMHPMVLPYFRWDDPVPSFSVAFHEVNLVLSRRLGRIGQWLSGASRGRSAATLPRPGAK